MSLPPLTEVLNSGFCGFYCPCQTYSQMSLFSEHLPDPVPATSTPFCLAPHPHPLTLTLSQKKNHLVCHSSFVSRENQQIIFSVLNKLLYFDITERGGCAFFVSLGNWGGPPRRGRMKTGLDVFSTREKLQWFLFPGQLFT